MLNNIRQTNYNLLNYYYEEEKSYIAATLKYIEKLGIEIEEFKFSELPKAWLEQLASEAREQKLLKDNSILENPIFNLIK
jgi:hypothetical protein